MSILGSLLEPATKLLDKVIEDKDQKNALAHEIATMAERHAQELGSTLQSIGHGRFRAIGLLGVPESSDRRPRDFDNREGGERALGLRRPRQERLGVHQGVPARVLLADSR